MGRVMSRWVEGRKPAMKDCRLLMVPIFTWLIRGILFTRKNPSGGKQMGIIKAQEQSTFLFSSLEYQSEVRRLSTIHT